MQRTNKYSINKLEKFLFIKDSVVYWQLEQFFRKLRNLQFIMVFLQIQINPEPFKKLIDRNQ